MAECVADREGHSQKFFVCNRQFSTNVVDLFLKKCIKHIYTPYNDIVFEDTQMLSTTIYEHCHTHMHLDAIKIHKNKGNFNLKEETLKINKV